MTGNLSRIIISRTDAIGDVMLTLPMCGIIKQYYPNVELFFLGKTYTEPIIKRSKYIDYFINYDEWNTDEAGIQQLKKLQADAVIHVLPDKRIASIAKKASIPLRVGTSRRWYHWLYVNEFVFVKRKNSPLHEAQLNIQLLKGIGIHELPDVQQLHKYVSFSANKVVPEKISSLITPHKKRIILHPKSAGSAREWPWQHYSSLADLLNPADYDILLCGTTKEKKMLEKSGANFPKHVIDIMGMLSLDEYIELISSSNAIVAASTGPLHIGAACGIFAIGIYPVIKPMHPARWQPIGENALYLSSSKSSCNSCRRTPASCVCMNDVTPQQVFKIIEANGK